MARDTRETRIASRLSRNQMHNEATDTESVFGKRDECLAKQILTTKSFVRAALYTNYMNLRVSTLYRCHNYINYNYFSFKRS